MANLYVLNLDTSLVDINCSDFEGTNYVCTISKVDSETWYKRLRHPFMSRIESLSDELLIPKDKNNKT